VGLSSSMSVGFRWQVAARLASGGRFLACIPSHSEGLADFSSAPSFLRSTALMPHPEYRTIYHQNFGTYSNAMDFPANTHQTTAIILPNPLLCRVHFGALDPPEMQALPSISLPWRALVPPGVEFLGLSSMSSTTGPSCDGQGQESET
jgi:hypothetical protein